MRPRQDVQEHARLIESAMHGQPVGQEIGQVVRHSWSRCMGSYSLDPLQSKKPIIVERGDLQARRERCGALLPIARVEMLGLSRQMQHSQYGIMLTDRDGVILCYTGDPGFSDVARRSGFREGAVWSERELGTNGMGTCLMMQRSVIIHRSEHFLVQNTGLTCTAAPIFDMQGNVIAALDISGSSSEPQMHTLALVEIAALNIENRALLEAARSHYVLRFHPFPEFVSTPGEGVLVFDVAGVVIGANRSALELLGFRDHKSLCGERVDAVLDTTLAQLIALSMRPSPRPEPVAAHLGHLRLFAVVQAPAPETLCTVRLATPSLSIGSPDGMESRDPTMAANYHIARRVMNRDISILLLGETGTGKGHFAKSIHKASARAEQPLVAVNCAAIPEQLIESELFGYKPGAFTGAARQGSIGRILQADGGTLFLDEIGDMPLSLQARVLTVLEDREVMPLGGSKPVPVDIRIISATHCDLVEMIARGQFRDDLYYRLNGITLTIPPLRQRQDLRDLVHRLLLMEAGDRRVHVDEALVEHLVRCPWPGNVRQLRNVLRNILALSENDELGEADFDERWLHGGLISARPALPVTPVSPIADEDDTDTDDALGDAECEALQRTLEACHWNVSEAAIRLHVSRKTMYRKMHRHGLVRQGTGLNTGKFANELANEFPTLSGSAHTTS
ncbi:MAG: chemotaxis protein CheY [Hydrocarboniphaga sp.]|uniref:sigma-54-dependent Fis family transcriptional regulator n=1 Tax=Hydrocarboniphaga sp. TaxID=2033016 RepID=UPI002627C9AE|nr:sigma-54-dependent Fis family transcriptional regulator [Hydrocarboniphaga sp.]MDB5969207.1 chemotaxis protein CheY [Hydrocarboniphaga sp.]